MELIRMASHSEPDTAFCCIDQQCDCILMYVISIFVDIFSVEVLFSLIKLKGHSPTENYFLCLSVYLFVYLSVCPQKCS